MAIVNKLRYSSTDLSFQSGTSGFQLGDRGWLPGVGVALPDGTPGAVTESLRLVLEDTSTDNMAAELQSLALFQRYAATYVSDRQWNVPVWMHAKMNSETGEVRALVYNIDYAWDSSPYNGANSTQNIINVNAAITRHPYWERTAARDFPTSNPIAAAAAISFDYTANPGSGAHDIVGDAPARIENIVFANATAGQNMARFWIGIRGAERHGTVANYVPTWECEDGTNSAGAADTVDATASAGNMVRFTPGSDNTWLKVCTITLADVTANYSDNLGRFLWLLRYKVNSASTYQVRLRWGYSSMADADHIFGPIPDNITNSSYDFIEMGQCTIPLRNWQASVNQIASIEQGFQVQVWAMRTSGSGTLDVDCLVRIPIDQGYLVIRDAAIANTDYAIFSESAIGDTQVVNYDSGVPLVAEFVDYDSWNFRLPPGDGRMIISYARASTSDITDTIGVGLLATWNGYFERWNSLRGAE